MGNPRVPPGGNTVQQKLDLIVAPLVGLILIILYNQAELLSQVTTCQAWAYAITRKEKNVR